MLPWPPLELTRRALLAGAGASLLAAAQKSRSGRRPTMSVAQSYIDFFRRGQDFRPPASAFFATGALAEQELEPLAAALRTESDRIREQIVFLLADVGRRADPLFAEGGQIIRHPRVISILVADGLARPDSGRDAALDTLQKLVPASHLQPHKAALVEDLKKYPDTTALLLIAKAKPPEAAPVVRQLLGSPRWSREQATAVAAAALGDQSFEKDFTEPFVPTQDPREKARLARALGWIGTHSALTALASQMRTDLIYEVPRAFRRTLRLDIMAALSYNFPDQPVLYELNLTDDTGYDRIEQFCVQRFGVTWDRPRPPYMKIIGFPSR